MRVKVARAFYMPKAPTACYRAHACLMSRHYALSLLDLDASMPLLCIGVDDVERLRREDIAARRHAALMTHIHCHSHEKVDII